MFFIDVPGPGEANGCMGFAFLDEPGNVLALKVLRGPDLFLSGRGQGGVAGSGVTGMGTVFSGSAMACDGQVDGAPGLSIFGKDGIWRIHRVPPYYKIHGLLNLGIDLGE